MWIGAAAREKDSPGADLRLMADGAVADGDGATLGEHGAGVAHDQGADEHHGAVGELGAQGPHIAAVGFHLWGGGWQNEQCFLVNRVHGSNICKHAVQPGKETTGQ